MDNTLQNLIKMHKVGENSDSAGAYSLGINNGIFLFYEIIKGISMHSLQEYSLNRDLSYKTKLYVRSLTNALYGTRLHTVIIECMNTEHVYFAYFLCVGK